MTWLVDLLVIAGFVAKVLHLAAEGRLSVEAGALWLVGLVALLAVARATRRGMARTALRLGGPVAGLYVLIKAHASTPEETRQLTAQIIALIIALFGIYIMFRGVLPGPHLHDCGCRVRRRRRQRWNHYRW